MKHFKFILIKFSSLMNLIVESKIIICLMSNNVSLIKNMLIERIFDIYEFYRIENNKICLMSNNLSLIRNMSLSNLKIQSS